MIRSYISIVRRAKEKKYKLMYLDYHIVVKCLFIKFLITLIMHTVFMSLKVDKIDSFPTKKAYMNTNITDMAAYC